jgi:putative transposase
MARLPRLSLVDVVHYVRQRGHNRGAIVRDAQDAEQLLQILRESARANGVSLHAYAIGHAELRILATPDAESGVSRMMQSLGRRYAVWVHRRNASSGSLWEGRFRCALIEAGDPTVQAMRHVEAMAAASVELTDSPGLSGSTDGTLERDGVALPSTLVRSSLPHHTGGRRDPALVDPPEYWALGNTPFDRESRYRDLVAEPLAPATVESMERAIAGAWAFGSPAFLQTLAQHTQRPLAPRARGRPRRVEPPEPRSA